ncbi:GNAT family N-acetyltransferase [Salininema proteolyticum]|uniref:GNAT family N-acetyltransferase n=1 Tax=Salininema proteolyticum TaxID=1607685 RepID=A0ABV8TTZ5_9ACTN
MNTATDAGTGAQPPTLRLRAWKAADFDEVRRSFADDSMRGQFHARDTLEASTAAWLEGASKRYSRAGTFFHCVTGPDGRALANIACAPIDEHDCGWVSYWTVPWARGKGVASRALSFLVPWWHDEAGVARLELGHRANNPASGAVALRAGFREEGVQRGKLRYDGVRYDTVVYGRLSEDPRPGTDDRVAFVEEPLV